jgi:hypothetical protein
VTKLDKSASGYDWLIIATFGCLGLAALGSFALLLLVIKEGFGF